LERDLTNQFKGIDVDWSVVEKQPLAWDELFRVSKELRVDVLFIYQETGQQASTSTKKVTCAWAATQHILAERAPQLNAEEISGPQLIWRNLY
jgi:hypothetical protein